MFKWSQIPTLGFFLVQWPFYNIKCFCKEIPTTIKITFENSLFMVTIIVKKSEIFRMQLFGKMALKFKPEIVHFQNALLWPMKWIFGELHDIFIFRKVCNVYFCVFPLQIIFNRLKIDAKQIRFAAATLKVSGTNFYCDLSVTWSL